VLKYSGFHAEYFAPFDWLPRAIAWSPSGRWIAAAAGGGGLALIQPSSGNVKEFAGGQVVGMSWSPDGSSIAFTVDDQGVFVGDIASGDVRRIDSAERKIVGAVAWSPDGSEIAYADTDPGGGAIRQGVMAVDPSGDDPRVLLDSRASFGVYDLEWSPDGSRLAVMFHPIEPPTAGLLTMGADGSDVQNVAICENHVDTDGLCPTNGGPVSWSPDGQHLMFDNYPGTGHRFTLVGTDGSAVPVSGSLETGCCFAWQPS
jgi:Tol biopolymer transport system component